MLFYYPENLALQHVMVALPMKGDNYRWIMGNKLWKNTMMSSTGRVKVIPFWKLMTIFLCPKKFSAPWCSGPTWRTKWCQFSVIGVTLAAPDASLKARIYSFADLECLFGNSNTHILLDSSTNFEIPSVKRLWSPIYPYGGRRRDFSAVHYVGRRCQHQKWPLYSPLTTENFQHWSVHGLAWCVKIWVISGQQIAWKSYISARRPKLPRLPGNFGQY